MRAIDDFMKVAAQQRHVNSSLASQYGVILLVLVWFSVPVLRLVIQPPASLSPFPPMKVLFQLLTGPTVKRQSFLRVLFPAYFCISGVKPAENSNRLSKLNTPPQHTPIELWVFEGPNNLSASKLFKCGEAEAQLRTWDGHRVVMNNCVIR